jgi:hypothetical protein
MLTLTLTLTLSLTLIPYPSMVEKNTIIKFDIESASGLFAPLGGVVTSQGLLSYSVISILKPYDGTKRYVVLVRVRV